MGSELQKEGNVIAKGNRETLSVGGYASFKDTITARTDNFCK